MLILLLYCSPGELLLLLSFAGVEDTTAMDLDGQTLPRRIYAIVPLVYTGAGFQISNKNKVQKVPYQSVRIYHTASSC